MAGFIYVMSNPAFPHLFKIGKSSKDPATFRADELYTTGVPAPYEVEYSALVDDEHQVERILHLKFKEYRFARNREFFEIDVGVAIAEIRRILTQKGQLKYEEILYKSPEELAKIERNLDEQRRAAETLHQHNLAREQQASLRQQKIEERRNSIELEEKKKKSQENISYWKQTSKELTIICGTMGASVGLLLLNGELMNGFLFFISGVLMLIGIIVALRSM
jgi:hypothetical protein